MKNSIKWILNSVYYTIINYYLDLYKNKVGCMNNDMT